MKKNWNHLVAIFIYTSISFFFSLFLLKDIGHSLIGGDGIFTYWALSWDIHSFLTHPLDIFNANIFYPHLRTLAYSESTLAPAFLALPFFLLTKKTILVYNLLIFLSFILSAYGAFLLARYYTKNNYAAFIAGLIFGFGVPRLSGIGHFQNLIIFWIPFSVLFLQKYFDTSKRKYLLIASLLFSAQMLSCWNLGAYLFLFFIYLIAVNYSVLIKNIKKTATDGLLALLIAIILIMPAAYPYIALNREIGFQYPMQDAVNGSADIGGYLIPSPGTRLFFLNSLLGINKSHWQENANFLGFFSIFIILFYILFLRKKIKERNFKIFFWGIFIFVVLSFGPYARFLGKLNITVPLPYYAVSKFMHLGFIRTPSRLALIALFCLSITVAYILSFFKFSQNKKYIVVALLIPFYILFENWISFSDKILFKNTACPAIYSIVKENPSVKSLVELPISPAFTDMGNTLTYLYTATCHYKPILNGYSGFAPPDYNENSEIINTFPDAESITRLRKLKISHVLLHLNLINPDKRLPLAEAINNNKYLEVIVRSGEDYLIRIEKE
ncbi:MAG: hypothetical protein COS25_02575 [Candidatus Nealsonbacteria bacterium CG02_land_8_20_14_3_00_37_10]|uniref:Glycosyltransferase RgtA/B/C/D-like domain-containing protein n=2 Tax=Candidatus Nealsoniibacteriota TaxID=1817911 RepID=A0A2G9YXW7_9BACT|nr:MAG: hypothetical protein COX35_02680 [Candidatus Nealsonbacteria bacterium CG23_combo_of_CG06-09_8_20_14_all_37_18]PIV44937.1 MAG: hypothetical protein COS25_02575 [Candidatus Nealsonbacteria bacterium CG02_land_8_20_14_3_00_37_10]